MRRSLLHLVALAFPLLAAPEASALFDRQPLRFEQNRGQAPAEFQYVSRGPHYVLGLTQNGNELIAGSARVRTRLVGANPDAQLEPAGQLQAATNYFVGPRAAWRTGVSNFGRIHYRAVYPGIDLVFYGRENSMEYDFVVQPGANPERIEFEITGAEDVRIESGDLVIATASGEIRWKRPEIYQTFGNETRAVEGGFERNEGRIRFRIGPHDRSSALTIDPVLAFSTYLGGTSGDVIRGIGLDAAGNIYVCGSTSSRGWATRGSAQGGFGGAGGSFFLIGDAFVAKMSPAGTLVYLSYLGGQGEDGAAAIAVDAAGNAYVTGFTNSRDFPTTPTAAQIKFGGSGGNSAFTLGDAFVSKVSPGGDQILYSTFLGGFQDDYGIGIAIDTAGNAYVAGGTQSLDFPVTAGVVQPKFGGLGAQPVFPKLGFPLFVSGDAFVAKLNPDGSKFLFATYLGGTKDDTPFGIAIDTASNVYVAGGTLSPDFPTTAGTLQTKYGGADTANNIFFNVGDGFIAKLDPKGASLIYSTYLGGSGDDAVGALTVDSGGNAYVAGVTTSPNLKATASAFQRSFQGPFGLPIVIDQLIGDGFVAKLNPAGNQLVFLSYLGGESDDMAMGIALDRAGNIAVAGITQSLHFPVTPGAQQTNMAGAQDDCESGEPDNTAAAPPRPGPKAAATLVQGQAQGGGGDGFLTVFDPTGARLMFSTYLGGARNDASTSIAIDSAGNFYIAGATQSRDFPTLKASQIAFAGGESDGFVAKFTGFMPTLQAITNAASNVPGTAPGIAVPGMIFVGYGSQMGPTTLSYGGLDGQGNRVNTLAGVQILFDGNPAPIYYVSAGQVAGWVPYEVAGKSSTQVTVTVNGQSSPALTVPVAAADPGLFSANFSGAGPVAALNGDGSFNSPSAPAAAGSIVVLFGTGEGQTNPIGVDGRTVSGTPPVFSLPITVTIGGLTADVLYAGPAPGQTAGFSQLNLRVPQGVSSGNQPVVVSAGAFRSQPNLTVAIR